jgi:hypothetical protein
MGFELQRRGHLLPVDLPRGGIPGDAPASAGAPAGGYLAEAKPVVDRVSAGMPSCSAACLTLQSEISFDAAGARVPYGTPGSTRINVLDTATNMVLRPPGLRGSQANRIMQRSGVSQMLEINP